MKLSRAYGCVVVPAMSIVLLVLLGTAAAGVNDETVASVNGDSIKVLELREALGLWGGSISATGIPAEKKKEVLDRMIDARLLEQTARAKKYHQTEDFAVRVKKEEGGLLIPVLFRMTIASGPKIDQEEIRAESARLRKDDKNLSREDAMARAKAAVWQKEIRKRERELVAAARDEASFKLEEETIARIGKGENVEDNAVLGTAASTTVSYGDVKGYLRQMGGGMHGGRDLGADPQAVRNMAERELTARSLFAYAGKRKVEDSKWMNAGRRELERSILIGLLVEKEILKGVKVSEKEIAETYAKHSQMLVRDGKKIPLSEVKEDIRGIVLKEKRAKAIKEYLEKRKKKSKIKINAKLLPKV